MRGPQAKSAKPSEAAEERSIKIGRDAVGNVLVTGDRNKVRVTLVVADERLLAKSTPPVDEDGSLINPYHGLDAFYETDAASFFGREKLVRRAWLLFKRLQRSSDPRILSVVGASGSGKSSLVRAGLLPELAREPMENLDSPKVLVLRPGPAPIARLNEVLARMMENAILPNLRWPTETGTFEMLHRLLTQSSFAGRSRFIVVVDQFEELFTECPDSEARTAFLEGLAFAASQPDRLVSVVITLRSDFVAAVRAPTAFATAARENRLIVRAMDRDELYEAITRPAQELGHPWPSAFVEGLLAQAEGRAGALPLLQFALKRLWPDHARGRLQQASWSSRLIEDFLVQAADTLYETAGRSEVERAADQRIIRRAFIAMIQLGEGTEDTRRVAYLSEIVAENEDDQQVVDVLAPFSAPEARLVTASAQGSEATYELTHEALIASWERLRTWLGNVPDKAEGERIRADLRLSRRLSSAATEWKAGRGGLWRPPELDFLLAYIGRVGRDELTSEQTEFSTASKMHEEKRQRTRMAAVVGLALLAIVASLFGAFAFREWDRAFTAQHTALSEQAAAQRNLYLARMNLAQQALARLDIAELRRLLEAAKPKDSASPELRGWEWYFLSSLTHTDRMTINTGGSPITAIALSPSGNRLAFCTDKLVQVSDIVSGKILKRFENRDGSITAIAWSPDSELLAIGSDTRLVVWDYSADKQTRSEPIVGVQAPAWVGSTSLALISLPDHGLGSLERIDMGTGKVTKGPDVTTTLAAWSNDGKLAAAYHGRNNTPHHDHDYPPRLEILSTEKQIFGLTLNAEMTALAWSPDSKQLATAARDGTVVLRNSAQKWHGTRNLEGVSAVTSMAWSPDSTSLALASSDSNIRIIDIKSGKIRNTLRGHSGPVVAVAWSPDNTFVVSGGMDATIRVWDPKLQLPSQFHRYSDIFSDTIESFSWIPNQAKILLNGDDLDVEEDSSNSKVRVLDIDSGQRHELEDASVAWSPDGTKFIEVPAYDDIAVMDANTFTNVYVLKGHKGEVHDVAWSPDGTRLASGGKDGFIRIWDASTGKLVTQLPTVQRGVNSVRWRSDSKYLVAGFADSKNIEIWDTVRGQRLSHFSTEHEPLSVEWSADGKLVWADQTPSDTIQVWSAFKERQHCRVAASGTWSPTGSYFAARDKGNVQVWDMSQCRIIKTITGEEGWKMLWSPDGTLLASANQSDGRIKIWDARSAAGAPKFMLAGHRAAVAAIDWSSNNRRLASASLDGTVKIWDIATGEEVLTLRDKWFHEFDAISWSSDGQTLAAVDSDQDVIVWDARSTYAIEAHPK